MNLRTATILHRPPWVALMLLAWMIGCATPGLMKRWERQEQTSLESENFVIYSDENIPRPVGASVLESLEFAREKVGQAFHFYSDEKIVCNLYQDEKNLRNICVGLPLGFVVPRRAPLAYVLGGEVHGRLYTTPTGNVSRLWASTFPHEYCHVMFKELTGRQYFQYSWLQEGIGEYFRRLYLQENVLPPEFEPGQEEHFLLASDEQPEEPSDDPLKLQDRTYGIMSYTDWEVRTALRYDEIVPVRELAPRTFIGYWQKFNTPKANEVYAISSSLVEYLVNEHGWRKLREILATLRETRGLDEAMLKVYGFDQDGLEERWRLHLRKRWPDPWQPNIAMVYLVRGNWEVDGHQSGIRTAMEVSDIESARRHWKYLNSRSIGEDLQMLGAVNHSKRMADAFPAGSKLSEDQSLPSMNPEEMIPRTDEVPPPAVEHYETAMAAFSIGRFGEGVEHLLQALEIEPEQINSLRVHLARGFWLTGRRDEALQLYGDELLKNKELPFINEVAWCYEMAGKKDEALRLYRLIAESSQIRELKKHAQRRIDRLSAGDSVETALADDSLNRGF